MAPSLSWRGGGIAAQRMRCRLLPAASGRGSLPLVARAGLSTSLYLPCGSLPLVEGLYLGSLPLVEKVADVGLDEAELMGHTCSLVA
jgi:hypothetical protein